MQQHCTAGVAMVEHEVVELPAESPPLNLTQPFSALARFTLWSLNWMPSVLQVEL